MRVAVIGDVHSNAAAFQAVIDDFGTIDEVWCLGDLVGYGPAPNECIDLLRQMRYLCVAGNHDWAAVERISTRDFNPDAATAAQWTATQLTQDNRRFLEGLPLTLISGQFTLAHGSPRDPIWEYVLRGRDAAASFRYFDTSFCFVGHTHVPAVFGEPRAPSPAPPRYGEAFPLGHLRMIINPGSVGQPRDGFPEARYIRLDTDKLTIEYRHVPYDISRTQQEMENAGLPEMLIWRLEYGQ
ncbi:MAG: metallophosphatase family protein [Bacteroidetes bacterium]|nr:metallophosphatase family protein [Bacteroidota bacterium]MCL5027086.1 metallophosphatase family protein [Chloroflexota bacterium]